MKIPQGYTAEQVMWMIMEDMQGQIAAEIRVMRKEPPIDSKNFTFEGRQRRIKAMQECCATSQTDEDRHNKWVKQHEADGWVYGEQFDSALKTHPNLIPWETLPRDVQSKARIFDIVAKAANKIENLMSFAAEVAADEAAEIVREIQNEEEFG